MSEVTVTAVVIFSSAEGRCGGWCERGERRARRMVGSSSEAGVAIGSVRDSSGVGVGRGR